MPDGNTTQHATLGCGTLILIALIVMFFSRPGVSELERQAQMLQADIGAVKRTVALQSEKMEALEEKIDRLLAAKPRGKE